MSSTYTVADVDRIFESSHRIPSGYGDHEYDLWPGELWRYIKFGEVNNIPTELGVISLESEYGGEGQGDEYWVVVKITGHDGSVRFFKKPGWYQSYSGGELDGDTYEVRPREKMVTVYE